jgi:hypothetical protein
MREVEHIALRGRWEMHKIFWYEDLKGRDHTKT